MELAREDYSGEYLERHNIGRVGVSKRRYGMLGLMRLDLEVKKAMSSEKDEIT